MQCQLETTPIVAIVLKVRLDSVVCADCLRSTLKLKNPTAQPQHGDVQWRRGGGGRGELLHPDGLHARRHAQQRRQLGPVPRPPPRPRHRARPRQLQPPQPRLHHRAQHTGHHTLTRKLSTNLRSARRRPLLKTPTSVFIINFHCGLLRATGTMKLCEGSLTALIVTHVIRCDSRRGAGVLCNRPLAVRPLHLHTTLAPSSLN